MSAYGFEIVQTLIVDIEPDEHVKRAMNEINAGKTCVSYSLLFDSSQLWILLVNVLTYFLEFDLNTCPV